jgi:hypothetical protein
VDVGSNRPAGGTYRRRFDGCKCGYGIETLNYGRSSEGSKSWNAFPDDRGGQTRTRYRDSGRDFEVLITLLDSPHAVSDGSSLLSRVPESLLNIAHFPKLN